MLTNSKRLLAALNMPTKINEFIPYSKSIQMSMKVSPYFAASADKVAKLLVDITVLDAAQSALGTKPPTATTASRDVTLEVVKADLRLLRNEVQTAADNQVALAEVIIKGSGMSVKRSSPKTSANNSIMDGKLTGTLHLTGTGAGAHQWQQSPDGGTTIVHLDPTSTTYTTVTGLLPNQKVWFRNRQILPKNQYGVWSTWLPFTPKDF